MKRRVLTAASLSVFAVFVLVLSAAAESDEAAPEAKTRDTVTLTVDFGDGAQKRFPAIPWKKSWTVLDALLWAEKHPHGIELERRGRGERTLVTRIDDLKNGSAGDRNWIFRVNGKLADRSCAVFPLRSGDTILWRFERYQ